MSRWGEGGGHGGEEGLSDGGRTSRRFLVLQSNLSFPEMRGVHVS